MARPRIIKPKNGGEIHLKNVSPELADKIKAFVEGGAVLAETTTASDVQTTATVEEMSVLPYRAIGTFKGADGWYVSTVEYDPVTYEANFLSAEKAGPEKIYAIDKFKILAANHDFV